jgi:hypothetical protein
MDATKQRIETAVAGVKHGFKTQQALAKTLVAENDPDEAYQLAEHLLFSESVPVRMTGVLVLEELALVRPSLDLLAEKVVADPAWQVQEMLARAFDAHCRAAGYEASLPLIDAWLASPARNQRRAVTEGLRIWTSRPYFKQHPEIAIHLLSQRRDDPEPYVRESAGNALRDISRRYPDLVRAELVTWDRSNHQINHTATHAEGFLKPS